MNNQDDPIPGPLYIDDFSTAELLEELIRRLTLTNGLDFCAPARVRYTVHLLQGDAVREPEERNILTPFPPSMADILRQRLQPSKPTPDHDDVANDGPRPYVPTKEQQQMEEDNNALLMYQQIMRLAKKEGRW